MVFLQTRLQLFSPLSPRAHSTFQVCGSKCIQEAPVQTQFHQNRVIFTWNRSKIMFLKNTNVHIISKKNKISRCFHMQFKDLDVEKREISWILVIFGVFVIFVISYWYNRLKLCTFHEIPENFINFSHFENSGIFQLVF